MKSKKSEIEVSAEAIVDTINFIYNKHCQSESVKYIEFSLTINENNFKKLADHLSLSKEDYFSESFDIFGTSMANVIDLMVQQ